MEKIVCTKCNTENDLNAEKCSNCGFTFSNKSLEQIDKFVNAPLPNEEDLSIDNTKSFSKTSFETLEKGNFQIPEPTTNASKCHNCGYILSVHSEICPACSFNNEEEESTPDNEEQLYPNNSSPSNNTRIYNNDDSIKYNSSKTIVERNDARNDNNTPSSNKTIIESTNNYDQNNDFDQVWIEPNEQTKHNVTQDFSTGDEQRSHVRLETVHLGIHPSTNSRININEENIILNRDNIDQEDLTLSVNRHAEVYKKEDGKWYLKNHSSNKAVFKQVSTEEPLKSGDKILIGANNFYIFINEDEI